SEHEHSGVYHRFERGYARLDYLLAGCGETRGHPARGNIGKGCTMKNFQQNLLVILAICLCALCAYQWYGQTAERKNVQQLNQMVYDKSLAIRDYTNSIATLNHQVQQLDASVTELRNESRSNADKLV